MDNSIECGRHVEKWERTNVTFIHGCRKMEKSLCKAVIEFIKMSNNFKIVSSKWKYFSWRRVHFILCVFALNTSECSFCYLSRYCLLLDWTSESVFCKILLATAKVKMESFSMIGKRLVSDKEWELLQKEAGLLLLKNIFSW